MGILIRASSGDSIGVKVDVTNWRYLRDLKYNGGKRGTLIITNDCRVYFLQDTPIEFIYRVNMLNSETYVAWMLYVKSVLCCENCNGLGVVDWISNVVGVKNDVSSFKNYERDPETLIKKVMARSHFTDGSEIFLDGEFLLSGGKLEEGSQHCKKCLGSGLRLPDNIKVIEQFKERKLNEYM